MIDFLCSATSHITKKHLLFAVLAAAAIFFYWFSPIMLKGYDTESVTILALGDSLTEGMFGRNMSRLLHGSFHPYTKQLEKRLPGGHKFKVINSGISGERVPSMKGRLKVILKDKSMNLKNGIIIILGGTNDCLDMIRQRKNNTLMQDIKNTVRILLEMHELCRKNNVLSVVITIPPVTRGEFFEKFNKVRGLVNRELIIYSSKNKQTTLFADFGHFVDNLIGNKQFWDDGLHYTPHGYDEMGNFIFEQIKKNLTRL